MPEHTGGNASPPCFGASRVSPTDGYEDPKQSRLSGSHRTDPPQLFGNWHLRPISGPVCDRLNSHRQQGVMPIWLQEMESNHPQTVYETAIDSSLPPAKASSLYHNSHNLSTSKSKLNQPATSYPSPHHRPLPGVPPASPRASPTMPSAIHRHRPRVSPTLSLFISHTRTRSHSAKYHDLLHELHSRAIYWRK